MTQEPDNLEEDALFLAKLRVKGDASNSCAVIRRCVIGQLRIIDRLRRPL